MVGKSQFNFVRVQLPLGHMAHRLLRNPEADGWERSDFPIICESCLGDNPYIRMTRPEYDKECKICSRPFTVFRWRPGRDARYKKTEICQTCCKLKNVCQVCLLDLEYGLPVQVRDSALAIDSNDSIPRSDVNREFFAEEHDRRARAGIDYESSYGKVRPNDTILKLQRTEPYYKRNRAHVCSFYIRGECTRGAECPYRHEMPVTGELSQQNIKDRYYGVNDPVAMKLLNKAGEMPTLEPPEDESIRTLYVGGIDARISEQDLRDHFYTHGEIESIRMVLQKACAFVTYTTREGTEKAAEELFSKLVVKGLRLKLLWGRPQAPKEEPEGANGATQQALAHGGLLPRAVISQQHNQLQQDQYAPVHFYNIPPPPSQERTFYPSMDPQRMGALIPSQDRIPSVSAGSGEKNANFDRQQHYTFQTAAPPQGQFHQQFYPPPYGYMPAPPQPYSQDHDAVPPPPSLPMDQKYMPPPPGSDLSPPRKRRQDVDTDLSPPRKSRKDSNEDLSPPRKGRKYADADLSPPRKSRHNVDADLSLPRNSRSDVDTDLSPPRKSRKDVDGDLSPPRNKKQVTPHPQKEQAKVGLISGREISDEINKTKKDEWLRFQQMDPSVSGREAVPIYRDKKTGERISKEELLKSQRKIDEKPKEIKLEWGKGLAQKREAETKLEELELEKDKPFARTRDDPELDKILKERTRWGDPMAHLVKKKHSDPVLSNLGDDEKMKESGFIIPQDIPVHSWLKRGLDAAPNRYGIRPGRHWDGVDRSNGFEKGMFKRKNEKQATEAEAYLWSVADM